MERPRTSETPKPPIIICCSCSAVGRERLHIGYHGLRGKARCRFPTEQMTADGFDVCDAELEPLPDLAADRVAYLLQPAEGGTPLSYDDGAAS
jgi:hypothetical protein